MSPPPRSPTDDPAASREARFGALLSQQQRILYQVAYVYCRDPEDRRDLIQDIAVQLWRSFDSFDGRASAATWTYRVAVNVSISWRRSQARRIRDMLPIDAGLAVQDAAAALEDPDDRSRMLRSLIDGLDGMNRALMLLYLEGFDHGEIAATLGTSAGNVGTRLNRIKQQLQRQITGDNDGA